MVILNPFGYNKKRSKKEKQPDNISIQNWKVFGFLACS